MQKETELSSTQPRLSRREHEVFGLLASGCGYKEIASCLVISPNTVKTHVRNIYAKLGVTTRTHALLQARSRGWIDQ